MPRLSSSVRLPGTIIDRVERHPLKRFFVVLYQGHAFRASIPPRPTWEQLHAMLIAVSDLSTALDSEESCVSALTLASRPIWTKLRTRLRQTDEHNVVYLDTVDSAAFSLCIDDENLSLPLTPQAMSAKVFWGIGRNPWHDKSLQLVACSNGLSGHVCEHSLGDDRSFEPLAKLLAQGIFQEEESAITRARGRCQLEHCAVRPSLLAVRADPVLEQESQRVLEDLPRITDPCVVQVRTLSALGKNTKRSVDLVQVVLHLAGLRFFGSHFSSVETVQGFHHGANSRVLICDSTLPEVWAFCDAVASGSISTSGLEELEENRSRLFAALRALLNGRADKFGTGISWNWCLPALRRAAAEQQSGNTG